MSKDNILTFTNKETGKEYKVDMDVCDEAACATLDHLYEKEDVIHQFDFTCTIYALMLNCIDILSRSGYTEEDMMQMIIEHVHPSGFGKRH